MSVMIETDYARLLSIYIRKHDIRNMHGRLLGVSGATANVLREFVDTVVIDDLRGSGDLPSWYSSGSSDIFLCEVDR